MPQGNPEGFRSSIPPEIQEIVLATIPKLFAEGMTGFSFSFKEDKEVFVISKLNSKTFAMVPYKDALGGGVDFLMTYAKFIEEQIDDDPESEVQESNRRSEEENAINGDDNAA